MYNHKHMDPASSLAIDWERYFLLVKKIACNIKAKVPQAVRLEDLIQAGMVGLMEAMKNFNEEKGASFMTYAGIRIKGTIIDELRKGDWAPRSIHRNARHMSKHIETLENSLGRKAKDVEISESMDVSVEEYHRMILDIDATKISDFEENGYGSHSPDNNMDFIAKIPTPYEYTQQYDFKEKLSKHMESLTKKEQLVLALYYQDEKNLREIAEVIGVTESRVSQIHSQAVSQLKSKISDWHVYLN